MNERVSNPESRADRPPGAGRSLRGLELKLAVALVLPVALGAIVSSFLPWPEDRWPAALAIALLSGFGTWLWLRHSLVRPLAIVARALESRRLADLRGLPTGAGWGELSDVGEAVGEFLQRQRAIERDLGELAALRATLARLGDVAAQWAETEQIPAWRAAPVSRDEAAARAAEAEPAEGLIERLEGASGRVEESRREHAIVVGQVRQSVDESARRLRDLTSGAERQFLETTSLLTVLRELKRWSGELEQVVEALVPLPSPVAEAAARAQALVHEGLDHAERWAGAAAVSVDLLAQTAADGARVFDTGRLAAVRTAAAALSGRDDARPAAESLAAFLSEAEATVARAQLAERAAREGMAAHAGALAELRERLTRAAVELAPPALPRADDPAISARRALDRMREMVQDVLARGQRLAAIAERTSSEAHRSSEDMGHALDDLDGLAARVAAPGQDPALAASSADDSARPAAELEAPQRPVRVLGPADLIDDDEIRFHGA